jgi:hypothetical protein
MMELFTQVVAAAYSPLTQMEANAGYTNLLAR